MPAKKKTTTRGSGTKRTKGRRRRRTRRTVIPSVFPLAKFQRVNHKYVTSKVINPAAADTLASLYFRANDIYDPEVALGGHSSMLFDQLKVLYKHWIVIGSRIHVYCPAYDQGQNGVMIAWKDQDTTVPGSVTTTLEESRKDVRYKVLGFDQKTRRVTNTWGIHKDAGIKDPMDDQEHWAGDASNGPSKVWYYGVGYGSILADQGDLNVMIEITFNTLWFDPLDVAGS